MSRAFGFIRESRADISNCPRFSDKVSLAVGRAGRPVTYLINSVAGRTIVNPHWFLMRDIVMQTSDGAFHCRRRTSDFGVVSVGHEAHLRKFLDLRAGVFVDIGANIGKYSVLMGRRLGSRGRVVAIEPDPDNFAMLCKNVAANGLQSTVIAVNVACSSANGALTLYRHPWGPGLHTTDIEMARRRGYAGEFTEARSVPARTLDSILEELGIPKVDLIKIDGEYAELAILEGAARTLESSSSMRILVEATTEECRALLKRLAFELQRVGFEDYVAEKSITVSL